MNRVAMVVCMNKTLKYLLSPILSTITGTRTRGPLWRSNFFILLTYHDYPIFKSFLSRTG